MENADVPKINVAKIDQKITFSGASFALFLARCMAVVGFVLFIGGLIVGITLTVYSRQYGNGIFGYGSFFDRHEYAIVGIPLMSSALTFGLPFAAIGSYMSARLRSMSGRVVVQANSGRVGESPISDGTW